MKKVSILLGASLLLPLSAMADPSYNYIQGDWIIDGDVEAGANDTSYEGWNAKFSGAITPSLFIQGAHSEIELDNGNGDLDFSSLAIGVNTTATSHLDVFGTVNYESISEAIDADGYSVNLGLRYLPIEQLEIAPFVGYVDYGNIENIGGANVELDDGLRYGVEVIFTPIECLGITASYRQLDLSIDSAGPSTDVEFSDEVRVGVRLYL